MHNVSEVKTEPTLPASNFFSKKGFLFLKCV